MIDLRRLHVLRVLDEHGTVTAAAEVLHLTPSAVSQQIRLLSRDLGIDLLDRVGRGVRLTPAAQLLVAHADTLFAAWEAAMAAALAARAAGAGAPLRLCGFPTAVADLLVPAAARLRDATPPMTVQVRQAENAECFALLLAGDTDLAVVVPGPGTPSPDDPRFDQQPLLREPYDLVVPADHPLAAAETADLADVAREPWIAGHGNDSVLLLAACAAAGFTPRIAHRAEDWNAVVSLVTHSFGVCLMPRLAPIPAHHRVVRLPLRGEPVPSRRLLTCVRRGSRNQPSIARGVTAIAEVGRVFPLPLLPGGDHGPDDDDRRPHRHTYRPH